MRKRLPLEASFPFSSFFGDTAGSISMEMMGGAPRRMTPLQKEGAGEEPSCLGSPSPTQPSQGLCPSGAPSAATFEDFTLHFNKGIKMHLCPNSSILLL